MKHKKHAEIKTALTAGESIRGIAGRLHVSTKSVLDVKSQYPEFKKQPTTPIFARVPAGIFARFKAEFTRRGLNTSALLRNILSERYQDGDNFNGYILQSDCSCPVGSIVKNHNSNLDGDQFICGQCGRVVDLIGG